MEIINFNKTKEIKLIRRYKRKKDINIALYFFNKYKEQVISIIYAKINRKFSSIPLEKEDFVHIVWESVLKVLKKFNNKKGGVFLDLLVQKSYFMSVREAVKFISNKHIILNNAHSFESLLERNKNFSGGKNLTSSEYKSYEDVTNDFIKSAIELNLRFKPEELKRVIYLRSLGYSVREIITRTRMKKHKVNTMIDFMCKIAKKLYE